MMLKRKGTESFFYVLLAGLGIFILIAIISLSIDYVEVEHPEEEIPYLLNKKGIADTIKENKIYYFDKFLFKSLGNVEENKRTIYIGDKNIGNVLAYGVVREKPKIEIYNGLFGKKNEIIYFSTYNAKKVRISFVVNRTNRYGRLILKFNGKEIFRNLTYEGERILVEIEKGIKNKNVLEIMCESSLPKIWAPTKYEITNLRIEALDYISKDAYIEFEILPEEYQGLRYVEIKFNVLDTNEYAPLSFIVNGKKVFEDVFDAGAEPYRVWLYRKDNLKPGINVLRMETYNSSYYDLLNVEINIYYIGNAHVYVDESNFNINPDDYEFIEKNKDILEGVIEINTRSINLDKGIVFYINGARYTISNLRSYASNYLTFDVDLLRKGVNYLRWETQGNYEIKDIKIGVRKK